MADPKKIASEKMILRVNWIGIIVNILLGSAKVCVGLLGNSMALLADGIHSFSDLITDFAVVIGIKLAAREPDEKHPYGHEWYESASGAFIAIILVFLGGGMIYKSAMSIAHDEVSHVQPIVIWVAFFSIFAKEILYRITRKVARKTHSASLFANAWHHRSDALSSVAVVIGLLANKFDFAYGDQFATAAVGLMLILAGAKILEGFFREFTDASVDKDTIKQIEQVIESHEHVRQWHKLRTRTLGREVFLDFHLLVDPSISICTAHDIAEEVENDLHAKIPRPMNIIVHLEPDLPELRK